MRVAALDLGTNTFLCLIAEVEDGEVTRVMSDQATTVRLGQDVNKNRRFHPDALRRADECLRKYSDEIREKKVERIIAGATSAARDVANGDELLRIGEKHGIEIEIISGRREAEATYWGTLTGPPKGRVAIIDVGGGSTEFIVGDSSGILQATSVDVGSVRMTEMFITRHPVPQDELDRMSAFIREKFVTIKTQFASGAKESAPIQLYAVAGTPTTVAAVDRGLPFDPSVDGYRLKKNRLMDWSERFAKMTIQERQALSGMDAMRADVIVAGTMILNLACEALGLEEMEVSIRGLRYGLAKFAGGMK